jgi:hypothetical protein
MDTVFQPGTDNQRLKSAMAKSMRRELATTPGNVEALLATIRALGRRRRSKRKATSVFVFTVEEETTFKGVQAYVDANKGKIDQYIALDGGYEGFTYAGIGINWYRHHFIGPGGHTRSQTRRIPPRCRWRAPSIAFIN